jgi:hypothetical protein
MAVRHFLEKSFDGSQRHETSTHCPTSGKSVIRMLQLQRVESDLGLKKGNKKAYV